MKKYLALLVCVLLMLCGCGQTVNTPSQQNPPDNRPYEFQDIYAKEGYEQIVKLNEVMRDSVSGRLLNEDGGKTADLWTYGGYLTAAATLLKACPDSREIQKLATRAMEELAFYKCKDKDAYASLNGLERPVFFDDNAWLVYGLLEIYGVLQEEEILLQAEKIQNFIYTGWQENGGGILWREFDEKSVPPEEFVRNTCINAPAAMNSALLYRYTKKQEHLDWSKKIFQWTADTLKNPDLHTYYDDIDKNGVIGKSQFSYNSGCMISAGALLYNITKDNYYLEEVQKTAEGSFALFAHKHVSPSVQGDFYSDNSWFRTYLFLGYLDAIRYCDGGYSSLLDGAIEGYQYARKKKFYDEKGFLYDRWDGSERPKAKGDKVSIKAREVTGNIQSLAIFSIYENLNQNKEQ